MKIVLLLGLIINAHTLAVFPRVETTLRSGYGNVFVWDDGTFIYAHNYLSGSEFYDLEVGEIVIAYYSDGSTKNFEVSRKDAYAFGNLKDVWDMRVDQQWIEIDDVINMYSAHDEITLFTCYPEFGQTTGRLFLNLKPQEESNVIQPDAFVIEHMDRQ